MSKDTVIGLRHPEDGRNWECQCARCGSSMDFAECSACGGEGVTAPGELYEQDPLWYDEDDFQKCSACDGMGGDWYCISSPEWCEAHPIAGREGTMRHTPEWFVVEQTPKA